MANRPVNVGTSGDQLATLSERFIDWVEHYAVKNCPSGCLPTPGHMRDIVLLAEVARALVRRENNDSTPL